MLPRGDSRDLQQRNPGHDLQLPYQSGTYLYCRAHVTDLLADSGQMLLNSADSDLTINLISGH